jgi:ubiquinol-cytochrome c reductase cytochrome b subunit
MRILKSHPLLKLVNSYIIDSPQPSNLSYLWNFGSLLAVCLVIQIITGVTLAMHYNPSVLEAFNSVEHIMRDVNNGWLIRYLHSNTASAFFFLVYLHMGRGLYYGSYKSPRTLVWTLGTVIFLLMIITGFLGYVLPYGQMSLWGATVITNLMSAIPWIGQDIVEFLWGGFSVNNATLNRFFALHFVLPFVLAALVLMHLIALHDSAGSGNPLGVSGNYDRLPFAPYFLFKDLITIFIFMIILSVLVFFMPNVLGDSENYVVANPMQTPPAIVPEWYLLPFYAILRSIPNKLLGVIAMLSAILIILAMPFTDLSRSRGIQFRPLSKIAFYVFVANFLILMVLGAKHVESPFIEFGQISTVIYFSHFLIIVPFISLLENSFIELSNISTKKHVSNSNILILKSGFFPLSLLGKHLTLRNIIMGLLTLMFVALFKLLVIGGGFFDTINCWEAFLLSFHTLIFRLGLLGFVEYMCEQYLSDFKLGNTLFMNAGNEGGGNAGNEGGNAGNEGGNNEDDDDDDDYDPSSAEDDEGLNDAGYDSEDNMDYGFGTPPDSNENLDNYIVQQESGLDGVEYDRDMAREAINVIRRDPSTWTAEDERILYEADERNLERIKNSADARADAEARFARNVYANERSAERARANIEEAKAMQAEIDARGGEASNSNNNDNNNNNNQS